MNKTLMVGLIAGLMATSAHAQDGEYAWYVISSNESTLTAMDIGRVQREGNAAVAQSAVYMVRPTPVGDSTIDFIQTLDTYDCTDPGRIRNIISAGYLAEQAAPVFKYDESETGAEWKRFDAGSPGMMMWVAACHGPDPAMKLENVRTHVQVLNVVRQQAQKLGY